MSGGVFGGNPHLVEVLTPRQTEEDIDRALQRFAQRYSRVLEHGAVVSIPDNPMGTLHFLSTEVLGYLELRPPAEQLVVHLNTFHRKADLDEFLDAAAALGARYILAVSGDGGPRLHRLEPAELNTDAATVSSVELLRYIRERHPGAFTVGVAYNHYEPRDHEMQKLQRKIDAGARFVVTQPVLGPDAGVEALAALGLPVYAGAWMSPRLERLYECVGREPDAAPRPYDPEGNLRELKRLYPGYGYYLSLLSLKSEWSEILGEPEHSRRASA